MRRFLHFLEWRTRSERHAKKRRANKHGLSIDHARLVFEVLEAKTLLSVGAQLPAGWEAQPSIKADLLNGFNSAGSSAPDGLSPYQVRGAYGLDTYASGMLTNPIAFNGIPGDGSGQTIAIVDAYDDPSGVKRPERLLSLLWIAHFRWPGRPHIRETQSEWRYITAGHGSRWAMEFYRQ